MSSSLSLVGVLESRSVPLYGLSTSTTHNHTHTQPHTQKPRRARSKQLIRQAAAAGPHSPVRCCERERLPRVIPRTPLLRGPLTGRILAYLEFLWFWS